MNANPTGVLSDFALPDIAAACGVDLSESCFVAAQGQSGIVCCWWQVSSLSVTTSFYVALSSSVIFHLQLISDWTANAKTRVGLLQLTAFKNTSRASISFSFFFHPLFLVNVLDDTE